MAEDEKKSGASPPTAKSANPTTPPKSPRPPPSQAAAAETSPTTAKISEEDTFIANLHARMNEPPTGRTKTLGPSSSFIRSSTATHPAGNLSADALQQPVLSGGTPSASPAGAINHKRGVSWDIGLDVPDSRGTIDRPHAGDGQQPATVQPMPAPSFRSVNALPPRPRPINNQNRNASGDSNVSSVTGSPGHKPPVPPPARNNAAVQFAMLRGQSRLELEASQILNELQTHELQSETELIRNLDETNPLRPRAGTGNTILSDVPLEDAAHDFVIEDEEGLVLNPSGDSGGSGARDGSSRGVSSRSGQPTARRARAASRDVSSKTANQASKAMHKRVNTVEETLFGLNSAWEEMKMHDGNERDSAAERAAMKETPTNDLYANAEILFNRNKKKDGPPKEAAAAAAPLGEPQVARQKSTKWGVVKNAVAHSDLKKTDGDAPTSEGGGGGVSVNSPISDDVEHGPMGAIDEADKEESDEESPTKHMGHEQPPERSSVWKDKRESNPFRNLPYANKIKHDWETFSSFLRPRQKTMVTYARVLLFYVMLPSLAVACILYYFAENPPNGKCPTSAGCDPRKAYASVSWWCLFLGCRQMVIVSLAVASQSLVIDFFALRTSVTLKLFGPMFTLFLVQSRGWPICAFFWGLYNFALVVGDHPFSNHWLFWQDFIGLMNARNPPGYVTSSMAFYRIVSIAMCVGVAVAAKRVAVGIYLGRQTFSHFSTRLSKVMNKMLIISELARFGQAIEERAWQRSRYSFSMSDERLQHLLDLTKDGEDGDDGMAYSADHSKGKTIDITDVDEMEQVIDPDDTDPYTGALSLEQKRRITDLLGQWEEPARQNGLLDEVASVGAVMQFRRALAHMDTDFPFGATFGNSDTREACIACSQALYDRLMMQGTFVNFHLSFNVIAYLAMDNDGELDQEKTRGLIRMFRPDRNGGISLVEFVRAIDKVYKELRLLRATVAGNAKIDRAAESMFNVFFYLIVVCVILYAVGIDPLAIFLSISSIILAFTFMIGSASAKYFEGVLLILIQRPYGIGDRISISDAESIANTGGAQTWFVEDVTLFTTKLILAATGERATIANGIISKSRIINGARSPNAILYVSLRFGIETPYRKIETFRKAVEIFVKSRPREWSNILGFRVNRIETELGFIEYSLCIQHRDSWQNLIALLNSRHTVQAYCLELSKRLDMRYKSPPLPVDLNMVRKPQLQQIDTKYDFESAAGAASNMMGGMESSPTSPGGSVDLADVTAMFDD